MQAQLFCDEAGRHLGEGIRRISKCLALIDDADVWRDLSPQLASVGNLILHLQGNVSQYILRGLGGREITRNREAEFTHKPGRHKQEMLADLKRTVDEACRVIGALTDADLDRRYHIQGFDLSGTGVVMHVVEHFSYHVGQITLAAKLKSGQATDYYAGQDLSQQ